MSYDAEHRLDIIVDPPDQSSGPTRWVIGLISLMVLAAFATIHSKSRLRSILSMGVVGYSMAMLFCEALGHKLDGFDIRILATDIDKSALEKAPWGSYDESDLRKMRPHLLFKYFTRFQDRYVVSDRARVLVTFSYHDIVSDNTKSNMDLVLCRNLLIYFQKELQEKALHNIHSALNSGGFLILGMTETITPQILDYFEPVDSKVRIFKKL